MQHEPRTDVVAKRRPAVVNPTLARGTFLAHDLDRLAAFCEEALGLEAIRLGPGHLGLRDRRMTPEDEAYWMLDVRTVGNIEIPQSTLNHWGVTVDTREEVDQAYANIVAMKERYGLKHVQKPREQHQSYSFYIADGDSNWWEVECREAGVRYEELTDKHWLKGAAQ